MRAETHLEPTRVALDVSEPDDGGFVAAAVGAGWDEDRVFFEVAMRRVGRLIRAYRDRCRHIMLICMPKSASTYLARVLVNATGFEPYLLNTIGNDSERDIDLMSIPMFLARDTVSQEHMRATGGNVALLRDMGLRPVVLVRDIFDVIVSARDHALRESTVGPAAHVPKGYVKWSKEDQLWLGVRMVTPWLLNFYCSWRIAADELDLLWITYEDVTRCPEETTARILDHAAMGLPGERIAAAIGAVNAEKARFNRGISGRGRTELCAEQIRAVEAMASVYADVCDLSLIGLC